MILETADGQRRPVRRLMIGTSWLGGETRVIVVSRRRMVERGPDRALGALRRWAYRGIARLEAAGWQVIDGPSIRYSDEAAELFLRNVGAYRIDVPAVRRDGDES